jgi:hypothetical protein
VTGGGLVSPICVVSTVEIMTNKGWKDINNITQDFQQPFQLYRENEKTYLQVEIFNGNKWSRTFLLSGWVKSFSISR